MARSLLRIMHPVLLVVGARPNFVKAAAIVPALKKRNIPVVLLHTGQHYDTRLSRSFFRDLNIQKPAYNLNVGSGTHATQTARIMERIEPILTGRKFSCVLVVGDVNSTVAAALVATKLSIPVVHVEAGLRSGNRRMAEEVNRILTDHMSDLLFTTEKDGGTNLLREGIDRWKIHFVGNVMIDTLLRNRTQARKRAYARRLGFARGSYALLTLHRPELVDNEKTLSMLLRALQQVGQRMPILFPVHPRTKKKLASRALAATLKSVTQLHMLEPLGYLDFLSLMDSAAFVITDSGGIQEETSGLGVPCITVREETERPATVRHGTNVVVGFSQIRIHKAVDAALKKTSSKRPPLWDGHAADRIAAILRHFLLHHGTTTN